MAAVEPSRIATAGAGGTLALACYHCGQPVPRGVTRSVTVEGVPRPMCCAGCEAVASAILAGGLADYYRHREAMGNRPDGEPGQGEPDQALAVYDDPEFQRGCVRTVGEGSQTTLLVDDMRCGACVWLIERTLAAQPGVVDVGANLTSGRLTVTWTPGRTRLSALIARLAAIGYRATPFDAQASEQRRAAGQRALMRRLFVAGLAMMQVMMYALPAYTATPGDLDPAFDSLMRWASLVLTLPVMVYSATPFFAGAWRDLRNRRAGMDVPVAIGLVAAFAASVAATVRGAGEVWFDTVTMFVFLLLTARWFEQRIHLRAGRRIDALVASLPDFVTRRRADGGTERVPAGQARAGDKLLVGTGETFALDARLTNGHAQVDQSMLTGESRPLDFGPGDEIAGGSLNLGAPVVAEVVRDSLHSTGSLIRQLTDRAAADKPRIAVAADRVAAVFVAALLLLAAGVFAVWHWIDPAMALPAAIAVLVVSCPCALSLATPAALAAAGSALLDRGLLVTRSSTLEALAGITDVIFDKTGTLTTGRPRLVAVQPLAAASGERGERDRRWLLQVAAALEAGSSHPHARALRAAAAEAVVEPQAAVAGGAQRAANAEPTGASGALSGGPDNSTGSHPLAADDLRSEAGRGVSGTVEGERFRLGS
nr:heavy metal translocating P-type ATPase metal-binding domain-containing protein [Burkholderiaceae bacterium]